MIIAAVLDIDFFGVFIIGFIITFVVGFTLPSEVPAQELTEMENEIVILREEIINLNLKIDEMKKLFEE